jgi:hypothetical protein
MGAVVTGPDPMSHGSVDLYWIPLGAGASVVRLSGRLFEAEAVDSPTTVTDDLATALRVLDLVPSVPTPVWGRDELGAGEMWNSNSVTSWLLTRGGIDTATLQPPGRGRTPGWDSGLVVAARDIQRAGRPQSAG